MKPYTMNILSGIDRLRQVISQFAFICPRDENMKLQLSINYPKWHLHTSMLVASQGAGLDIFFATGDMMLSETEPQDKALVMQLRKILNNTVQVVLMNTASSKIVMKYHSRTASGFGLLQMIRHGFSQITSRQLFSMFNTAFDAAVNKSPDENTLTLLNDICAHFNNSKDSAQIMGLFYLRMFNSEQAYARVLDVTNPNISLSSIENTLQDLVPTTHGSAIPATSNKSSANGLKCYKCRKRGHVTRDCPAADGKTAGNTVALVNSSPNSTSGISWAMFNSKEGSGIPSPSYILDSGATLHISNTRAQSGTFTFSHVAVHYISFSDDEASKIATACSPLLKSSYSIMNIHCICTLFLMFVT